MSNVSKNWRYYPKQEPTPEDGEWLAVLTWDGHISRDRFIYSKRRWSLHRPLAVMAWMPLNEILPEMPKEEQELRSTLLGELHEEDEFRMFGILELQED